MGWGGSGINPALRGNSRPEERWQKQQGTESAGEVTVGRGCGELNSSRHWVEFG